MVGMGRLELPTSRLSVVRSSQLSYTPILKFAVFSSKSEAFTSAALETEHFKLQTSNSRRRRVGGGYRIRTDDILLAKQTLYQLS